MQIMKLQGQYQCALMAKGFVGLSLLAAILLLPAAWTSAAEGVAQTLVLRYATPGSGTGDAAYAIDLDSEGNVIVAGSTFERFTGAEMLVLKYSGAGAVLWTNRYNGPANGDDIAQAVAVDGSGNIFATGSSQGIGSGNLFVTGYSLGESKNYNYATIKYSNAGAPLWTNLYHTMATFFSYPNALAVDSVGNVFVTGIDGTVAYSNAGLLLWVNRGLSGDGIVVDGSGNVVVAGYSGGDYVTV